MLPSPSSPRNYLVSAQIKVESESTHRHIRLSPNARQDDLVGRRLAVALQCFVDPLGIGLALFGVLVLALAPIAAGKQLRQQRKVRAKGTQHL